MHDRTCNGTTFNDSTPAKAGVLSSCREAAHDRVVADAWPPRVPTESLLVIGAAVGQQAQEDRRPVTTHGQSAASRCDRGDPAFPDPDREVQMLGQPCHGATTMIRCMGKLLPQLQDGSERREVRDQPRILTVQMDRVPAEPYLQIA